MNTAEQREKFIDIMARFTVYAGKYLPDDVYAKLKSFEKRKIPPGYHSLRCHVRGFKISQELERPLCQDTGVISILSGWSKFPLIDQIEDCLVEAVKKPRFWDRCAIMRLKFLMKKTPATMWAKNPLDCLGGRTG